VKAPFYISDCGENVIAMNTHLCRDNDTNVIRNRYVSSEMLSVGICGRNCHADVLEGKVVSRIRDGDFGFVKGVWVGSDD
jgi:hypothetical protein